MNLWGDEEFARNGYKAYGDFVDWKNYAGLPMPLWASLPLKIQGAWKTAATQIRKEILKRLPRVIQLEANILSGLGREAIDYYLQNRECLFCRVGDHKNDGGDYHEEECSVGVAMQKLGLEDA